MQPSSAPAVALRLAGAARGVARFPTYVLPSSDEELMRLYVAGDMDAFEALFHRYAPRLMRIMRRDMRCEDVHELVQQTFLQLHQARCDYDPQRPLRPWLMTIAFNLKREHFRRRRRQREVHLSGDPRGNARQPDELLSAEGERLRAALEQLPDSQREIIVLHWFDELGFSEIAPLLGLTVSAAKVRAHRGYRALRQLLEESSKATGESP